MNNQLLELNNISLKFEDNQILKNIAFNIHAKEIVTLIGPNGAGKTSLVKIILGLLSPTSGSLIPSRSLTIGYMPQKIQIDQTLPLNVKRFLRLAPGRKLTIQSVMALTGIERIANTPIQSISGGELQRVLLARAILRKPDLLVLDEPAQGVDISGQNELYNLIRDIREQFGCAIFMVSHDLHLVMAATDKVICLNQHICCSGHPEQVSNDPAYLDLFGPATAPGFAVYHHHHDHEHNVHGDVVPGTHAHACEDPHAHTHCKP
ncbi:MAG: zinc ABC transporter ATP-binding protein ZnuC [Pseudomonadales bacterium]|uniref:Zinc ABC transporter ATPase n=1 Tax=Oleiphilus messinensis TaxID=141451 RepID=A0A1Y0I4G7_9GAMM|nr:zinc ABC transporter ATP-binding protein ZnuC [Oleiphilus messinensis]ARU54415.1 zinc ABC transporter ATPase [Oleiphilus messinensis]MCG8612766.1 zinc ABC transporter ATP-binding protein ZnuC [Pseudomonadales bacterium]